MDSIMYLDVSTPCTKGEWNGCFKAHDSFRTEAFLKDEAFVDHLVDKIYRLVHKKNTWEYTFRTSIDLYYLQTVGYHFVERHFAEIAFNSMNHTFDVLHWPNGSDGCTIAIKESHGKLTKGMIKAALITGAKNCYNIFPDKEDEA